ncbi:MAG: S1 family peptidase, partial [Armatimonadota bacterium]|nr:S1 family peptidase [Armatimonadota bacterium]
MRTTMTPPRTIRYGLCALAVATITLTIFGLTGSSLAGEEDNLGTSRQALVGGQPVDAGNQEAFTLLSLTGPGGSCSASLVRNDWAITAAHCVEVDDADGNPVPDPARPGQNTVGKAGNFLLLANWKTVQQQPAVQIETFRPYDVAIIKVAAPFNVHGSTFGFSRLVFNKNQFPHFGQTVPLAIMAFGRGIYQFASGS